MTDDRSHWERMLAGEPYIADDPEMARQAARARAFENTYNDPAVADDERARVLREWLGAVGDGTYIRPPLRVDYGFNIRVGDHGYANLGLVALDVAPITIGDDVLIGPNVQLLTPTHPVEPGPRRDKWEGAAPITIGHNVWLGGGAIVLAGVTIGDDSVVGAGAVVTRDVPAGVVVVGNPARVLRRVDEP
ncbi:MAG: sugar O-acetyltransferase [Acidimicrobiales bacterium]|nr:sugar O-acetyltransferase [Acidimicrobiales bacterium]